MCNSIRSFFRITFFAVISTFVLFSVSSCSDLFSYITSASVSNSNAGETITFTGTVRSSFSNGGAIPAEYAAQFAHAADGAESASENTAGRSAIPTLPNGTPTTTVTATATGEPDKTQTVTGDSFAIPLKSNKTWTVIVEMKNGSTTILSDSAEFDLTTVPVTTHEFVLKPVSVGSGTIALGFSTPDSAFDSVTVVSVKKNNEDASSAWTNSVNCSASGLSMKTSKTLAAGVYSVSLRFSKGAYSYTSIQEINVFPGLETNTWLVSNKDSDGKFQVTQSMMSMSEIYVGSTASGITASDTTGTGSPYKPYATVKKAIAVVNSLPVRTATDDPYIIRVKNGTANEVTSTITISNNISIECYDSSFSDKAGTATLTWNSSDTDMLQISSGAKLTIDGTGANPTWSGLVLDGNKSGDKKGRGAEVLGGGAFVMKGGTIKNFSLQDKSGSGVYVGSNGKFDMQGGMIKDNEATRTGYYYAEGGGVYVNEKATFAMSDGVLSGNSAYAGGGVFVSGDSTDAADNGLFMMSGGVIGGNSASDSGGGVDLVNGTMYMYGSAVIGDKNATAHAEAGDNQHSNTAKKGSAISTSGASPRLFIGYKEPAEGETDPRLDNDFDGGIYYNFATETDHNSMERGGAIFVKCKAENIKIANCEIKYNGAYTDGAGIHVYLVSGTAPQNVLDIKNTEISGNYSEHWGGGIYIASTYSVSMENCTVDNNIATVQGGGVFINQNAHFSASAVDGGNMFIRGNQAENGAGIFVKSQYCTISGAEISGNQASNDGGGIYVFWGTDYKCSLSGETVVKDNTATGKGDGVYLYADGGSCAALGLKDSAYVASNNDVYLESGSSASSKIFIYGALNPPAAAGGKVAKITPASYPAGGNPSGQRVYLATSLDATITLDPSTTLPAEVGKFSVTPNAGKDYVVNSDGKIEEDPAIQATAANVSSAITGMTQSGKVKVSGALEAEDFNTIKSSLQTLANDQTDPEVKVKLDLSGVTGVTELPSGIFDHAYALEGLVLPEGLAKVDANCFWDCSNLKELYIPASVTNFTGLYRCEDLESVTIAPGNTSYYVDQDLKTVFSSDGKKIVLCFARNTIEEYNIPDAVEEIGKYAFDKTSFVYLKTSANSQLKTICDSAFDACDASGYISLPATLTAIGSSFCSYRTVTVKYRGTEAQWNAITYEPSSTAHITMVYNYTGD